MKKIDQIRNKCEENSLNIYTVFREANVPSATIQNWERKEPEAFEKLDKINETIDKLISERDQEVSELGYSVKILGTTTTPVRN